MNLQTLRRARGVRSQGERAGEVRAAGEQPQGLHSRGTPALPGAMRGGSSWICVLLFLSLAAFTLLRVERLTQGRFSYALDDPYISLTLAKMLVHGHYGINAGEMTSPSSSILWPFLLMAGVGSRWHALVPLGLNLVLGCVGAALLGRIVDVWPWGRSRWGALERLASCVLFVAVANLCGLAFIGLEHVLQVVLAVGCAIGMLEAWRSRPIPGWCLACAVLGPAVRYENMALVVALAVALWGQRRPRAALLTAGLSLIVPVAFSLFLMAHGLSPLPSSVLAKEGAAALHFAGPRMGSIHRIGATLSSVPSLIVLVMALVLAEVALRAREVGRRTVALGAAVAMLLQLGAGQFGWFGRYEVYINVFGAAVLWGMLASRPRSAWRWAAAGLTILCYPYARTTMLTPAAAQNIYQQQYQMARFVHDYYRQSVAVNDIGWVSYDRPPGVYVLDLWGLASNEALQQPRKDAAWLEAITRRHHIGLAMIYPAWFQGTPRDWQAVAAIASPHLTAAQDCVVFFVTPEGDRGRIEAELHAYAATLPSGVRMIYAPQPGDSDCFVKDP